MMIGSKLKGEVGANPFVGPRPFETGRKIFGRDREIDDLYYLLSAERIVLLHSPSGAGKSSMVQAGLIPRLSERFDVWGPTRVNLQSPADQSSSPTSTVNRYVRSAMLGFEQQIPAERRRSEATLAEMTLAEYVATRPRRRSASQNIVMIFDQFEEILTADPLAIEAKHEFFEQLGDLLLDPHVWALFALREDYLPALDPYAQQVPTHLKNWVRLDLLRREAAREAISNTAAEGGRKFDSAAVDKLVRDLATMKMQQPDGTFIKQIGLYVEPLQLQVVCRGLWERMPEDKQAIDLTDIEQFGDVTNALSGYYSGEVARIAGDDMRVERTIREWVGDRLITPDGIRSQVVKGAGQSEGLDNELIASLVNTHLVRGEQRAGAVWYELAHDRLIEPVRGNNRDWFDAHLHKVQKLATLWEAQGRPEGLLLLGEELIEAKQWAAENESSLTTVERKFMKGSMAKQEAIEKEQRQARKLRLMLIAVIVVALVALGAAVRAYNSSLKASKAEKIAHSLAYVANMNLARSEFERGNHQRGFQLLDAYLPANDAAKQQGELRSFYWYLLERQYHNELATLRGHEDSVLSVAFSPDGRMLASASAGKTVKLWDAQSHKELATLSGHGDAVNSVAFSPDGRILASGSRDKTIKLWDVDSRKELATLNLNGDSVNSVAFSPDGRTLASANSDRSIKLWEVASRRQLATLSGHGAAVNSVTFSPDGRMLASASFDKSIKLWDLASRKELATLSGHDAPVNSVAFSPDGRKLASASSDTSVKLWDVASRNELATLSGHDDRVWSVAFSLDGRTLASASDEVKLWDVASLDELATLSGHVGYVLSVAFSPADRILASASSDNSLKLWDMDSSKELAKLSGHGAAVNSVAFSPNGQTLASASKDNSVKLWDVANRKELATLSGHGAAVNSVAFSPDGRTIASAGSDSSIKLWDVASRKELATLSGHAGAVNFVAFSPDGGTLASAGSDKSVKLWDVDSRKEIATLRGHEASVNSVAFSPNGETLASAGSGNLIKLWDVASRKHIIDLSGHEDKVWSVTFSPDGRTLASASSDNSVKLWDVTSQKELATLSGHGAIVLYVAFSPDGGTLASASDDKSVKLWTGATDKEISQQRSK